MSEKYKEFVEQLNKDWHKISPEESNYINFHQYCELLDVIGDITQMFLLQSNDSLKNHKGLYCMLLQGPEQEYTGSKFIKWLKKKLMGRPEILRIVFDDKYFTDVDMMAIIAQSKIKVCELLTSNIAKLIKKSQEKE